MYELAHDLPNDLGWDLGKVGDFKKISKLHEFIAQYPVLQNENFVNTSQKLLKTR